MYETSWTEITMSKHLCLHLRRSAERRRLTKEKLPSQEKLIKGKSVGTWHGCKKMNLSQFLGKENRRTLYVCQQLRRLRLSCRERYTVICVPIHPATVPIQSVMVRLARRGFQHCVVYCLLLPVLAYFAGMGIFRLPPEFWLFDGPRGHSQHHLNLQRKFVWVYIHVYYNCQLQVPCTPAAIVSAILSLLPLSWFGSDEYHLKMA